MDPRLTKFLALFLPFLLGVPTQPDIARILSGHPIAAYLVCGLVTLVATYLGIGISGPTAAPKMAARLGNPGVGSAVPPAPSERVTPTSRPVV
jgi:hypothetical protein